MLHEAATHWRSAWKDADPIGRSMILYLLLIVPAMLIGSVVRLALSH